MWRVLLGLAALAAIVYALLAARQGEPAVPDAPAAPASDAPAKPASAAAPELPSDPQQRGRLLFLQSAAWVAAGRKLEAVKDVFLDLEDFEMERDGSRHMGNLRLWYQAPDRFRWALRAKQSDPSVIKVLDGSQLWISEPPAAPGVERAWARKHGTPDGGAAIQQVQKDRDDFAALTRFLTLGGLAAKAEFLDEGEVTWPADHHLAGTWRSVRRTVGDDGPMVFLLASEGSGTAARMTWPGAVLSPEDEKAGKGARHVVLRRWQRGPGGARPFLVEEWTAKPGSETFARAMHAVVVDLRVNRGLPEERFQAAGDDAPERDP